MFSNIQMMGMDIGFPDVCKTPSPGGPVPITYPNGTYEVKNKAANLTPKNTTSSKTTIPSDSEVPSSTGDEPGTMKGVVSSVTMGNLLGNAPLLMRLVEKAHAKGYKVMIEVKGTGKATLSLQGVIITKRPPTQSSRGSMRSTVARSGTEGMEWLLRRLG